MSSEPSRSSVDAISLALDAAVEALVDAVRAAGCEHPVVLIDGRSGAGKTTVARELVARWPLPGNVQLIALDSLYPGWDSLAAGAEYARERILEPHSRGIHGVWRRWDWEADERAETHEVDPALPLIVEGAGVLTPRSAELADIRVWIDAPADTREARAIGRDGDAYRPHWTQWALQEERHLADNRPRELATHLFEVP
ncbi:nucleoside/nucleotide kinase family protein [Microbacterium pullorum]|uniref:hypothetical protein n=1 Tax=Microbacterium pullorum TaxID=2762236 RepID=UPI00296A9B9F|nr:hypothetical protein [Microbacterium pullorum]